MNNLYIALYQNQFENIHPQLVKFDLTKRVIFYQSLTSFYDDYIERYTRHMLRYMRDKIDPHYDVKQISTSEFITRLNNLKNVAQAKASAIHRILNDIENVINTEVDELNVKEKIYYIILNHVEELPELQTLFI